MIPLNNVFDIADLSVGHHKRIGVIAGELCVIVLVIYLSACF